MYENHYSFSQKPFELVPNPDFLFQSSTHKKAITYLDYGIKEKIGFILLTGEIGSGKTTIVRNLVKNLSSTIRLSRVNNTKVSSEELIAIINEDFGLVVEGKTKTKMISELNAFLIEQYANKIQTILLIDEAQNLSADLLEEVRLLSNLETDKAKLLQIILVGQPELKQTLMRPELMQLRQRININYHISPLDSDETSEYIRHRLTIAGNPEAIELNEGVLAQIQQFSRGIPRLINIFCDFALLSAFVEGVDAVNADVARDVARDLKSHDYWNESSEQEESETDAKAEDPELMKVAGDLALRLIKLEESVKDILVEISELNEKSETLEKNLNSLMHSDTARKSIDNNKSIPESDSSEGDDIEGDSASQGPIRYEDKGALDKLMSSSAENATPQKGSDSKKNGAHQKMNSLNKFLSDINRKVKKVK